MDFGPQKSNIVSMLPFGLFANYSDTILFKIKQMCIGYKQSGKQEKH